MWTVCHQVKRFKRLHAQNFLRIWNMLVLPTILHDCCIWHNVMPRYMYTRLDQMVCQILLTSKGCYKQLHILVYSYSRAIWTYSTSWSCEAARHWLGCQFVSHMHCGMWKEPPLWRKWEEIKATPNRINSYTSVADSDAAHLQIQREYTHLVVSSMRQELFIKGRGYRLLQDRLEFHLHRYYGSSLGWTHNRLVNQFIIGHFLCQHLVRRFGLQDILDYQRPFNCPMELEEIVEGSMHIMMFMDLVTMHNPFSIKSYLIILSIM